MHEESRLHRDNSSLQTINQNATLKPSSRVATDNFTSQSMANSNDAEPLVRGHVDQKPVIPDNLDATIALNAFYAIALSMTFLVMFLILRKKFKWIYYPNTAPFKENHPLLQEGRTGISSWKWVRHTLFLPDTQLLTLVGMDAFILIMTLKMLFWIFLILSVIASLMLLPVYASGTYGSVDSTTSTQIYSRLSIAHLDSGSQWLWIPAIAVWIFSLVFVYALVLFYSAYVHLRQAYISSPASLTSVSDLINFYRVTGSLEKTYTLLDITSRTVLIRGLDVKRFQTEESVSTFFDQCSVGLVMESVFIKDHPTLRQLIRQRNTILRQLESACMQLTHAVLSAAASDQLLLDQGSNGEILPSGGDSNGSMASTSSNTQLLSQKPKIASNLKEISAEKKLPSTKTETTFTTSQDNTSIGADVILAALRALAKGERLPINLSPLNAVYKRSLLKVAFDCSFLVEFRPRRKKSFWGRLFNKKTTKDVSCNVDTDIASQMESGTFGVGSISSVASNRDSLRGPDDITMSNDLLVGRLPNSVQSKTTLAQTDLITYLSEQLASIDELIEEERLTIFNQSRLLVTNNEQEAALQVHQTETLNLSTRALINDTRLLLVDAVSSTPPSQNIGTSSGSHMEASKDGVIKSSQLNSKDSSKHGNVNLSLDNPRDKSLEVSFISPVHHQMELEEDSKQQTNDSKLVTDINQSSLGSSEGKTIILVDQKMTHNNNIGDSSTCLSGLAADNAVFFSHTLFGEALQDARLAMPGQTRAAFVTFRESIAASIISQVLVDGTPFSCSTRSAPRPNEILWGNITLPPSLRAIRSWTGIMAVILLNLTWFIPVTFVNSLNQINRIAQAFPGLGWVLRLPRSVQTLIEGLLAPLLLNILLVMIPYALECIARYEGVPSKTLLQRSLMRKYLAFLYLQTFFVSFLSGSIFSALVPFTKGDLSSVISEIRQMLVPKSSFFFNLIAIKIANDLFLALANPVGILLFFSLRATQSGVTLSTPRERQESRSPDRINYGILLPLLLFAVPLILTYAVISPLMLGIGTIYYGIAYLVYRHRFLYAVRSTWESGGSFLYDLSGFLLVGLGTFQMMTAIQLSFQGAQLPALVVIPSIILTFAIWRLISRVTHTASSYVPAGARPDLASAAAYPIYKRSIPRLHARDAMSLGAHLGGRSTLDLIAVLVSRQKQFLAEAELGSTHPSTGDVPSDGCIFSSRGVSNSDDHLLRPTPSSEAVSIPVLSHKHSLTDKATYPGINTTIPSGDDELVSSTDSGSSSIQETDSTSSSLRETVEWYMSNPYRNPTLFKRLNSLYLPRNFFQMIQIVLLSTSNGIIEGKDMKDHHPTDDDNLHLPKDAALFEEEEEIASSEFLNHFGSSKHQTGRFSFAFDNSYISEDQNHHSIANDKGYESRLSSSSLNKCAPQLSSSQIDYSHRMDGESALKRPPSLSLTNSDGSSASLTFNPSPEMLSPPVINLSR